MFLSELTPDNLPKIATAGTRDGWSNAANMLFGHGCEGQAIALLASFASPLLSLVRMDGDGGALLWLWGKAFSGKTVAYEAALSVWGDICKPIAGMTGHEREVTLNDLGCLPALHDKIIYADPSRTSEWLEELLVTERRGVRKTWKGLVVAFTPLPIVNVGGYGCEFEIAVPKAMKQGTNAKRGPLAYDLESNRGHAGLAFCHHMIRGENRAKAKTQIGSTMGEIKDLYPDRDNKFERRVIASIYTAALVVTKMGLLDFDPERIKAFMVKKIYEGEKK